MATDSEDAPARQPWLAPRDAAASVQLPRRYSENWKAVFLTDAQPKLVDGAHILDVGSGRQPVLAPEERPAGTTYVGLDVSGTELRAAPPEAYDEIVEADVVRHIDALDGRFSLALSWQVFEHVSDLRAAAESIRSYLVPGGLLVALLSGANSAFGVTNRLIPKSMVPPLLRILTNRPPETIFPTHYDHCSYSGLQRAFAGWSKVQITPKFRGASYFRRYAPGQRAYLRYENWAAHSGKQNLATHYLVSAYR